MWKILLAFALALPCAARAELVHDTGFGSAGTVQIAFPVWPSADDVRVKVLPDRRVVVAVPGLLGEDPETVRPVLWLTRLQPDGSIDPTFGNGALVELALSSQSPASVDLDELSVRPDGSLYALVSWRGGTPQKTILVSVTADGRLDPAFNGGAPLNLTQQYGYGRVKAFDVAGGYLVVGLTYSVGCCNVNHGFDAWRLRADGTPDPAFGNNGSITVPSPSGVYSKDVMPISGGGFQVLHHEYRDPSSRNYWRRYRADGSLDTAFGNGGEEDIPTVGNINLSELHPLGDGTFVAASGPCPYVVFAAQGHMLSRLGRCLARGAIRLANVQPYGQKILVSADQRVPRPAPDNGTYLWVHERNGTVDRAFANGQGDDDRWRSTTNPTTVYSVAADADRGVVLATNVGMILHVQRFIDVRRGAGLNQPIPALGVPAVLLLLGGAAVLARRRLARAQ